MKFLIINADDFGWDPEASNAIIELAKGKKISSISVMANLVDDDEVEQLKQLSGISIGLHINFLCGSPLCPVPEIKSLVDRDGYFYSQKQLLLRALLRQIKKEDVEKEVNAQLNRLKEAGIEVSHADSHQHIHQYPVIGNYVLAALQKTGIQKVRRCDILKYGNLKQMVIKLFYVLTQFTLKPFSTPGKLISDFSLYRSASLPIFENAIKQAFQSNQVVEFMTHPAKENREGSYLNRKEEYEFWLLQDITHCLSRENVELVSYHRV